jgi:dTDP-4-amino-4,6-dideoxygalactose transaminase
VLLNKNEENFRSYCKYLERVAGVELIDMSDAGLRSNFQYVVLRVTSNFSASREQVVQALHKENVHARKYFCPGVHEMEPYKSEMVIDKSKLKHTIEAAEQVIVLPTGELLNDSAIQQICEIIRLIPELYKSSA